MQLNEERVAELRSFLADHNIPVDEAELQRLLDMAEGSASRRIGSELDVLS